MNVLPLVSAFILLFAIGSYTFIHQFKAGCFEKESYSGSMRLQRDFRKTLENERYAQCPGKPPPKKEKETTTENPTEKTAYTSPRDQNTLPPEGKLNLSFLIKEENTSLKKVALDLLDRLYHFTKVEIDPEALLSQMLKTLKKDPSIDTFEKLLSATSKEQAPLLYKLIKGTYEYQISTSSGIPPLGDFFTLDQSSHAKPIHFAYASRSLLQAAFGDLIAPQIIQKEKEKWEKEEKHKPLKKEELETLLIAHRKNPADYAELLSFTTRKSGKDKQLIKDKKSYVRLKFE